MTSRNTAVYRYHGIYIIVGHFLTPRIPTLEVAPIIQMTFSFCDRELWLMTLTFDIVKVNQCATYFKRYRPDTGLSDCSTWTTKINPVRVDQSIYLTTE